MKMNKFIASLCAAIMLVTATPVYATETVAPTSVEYETQDDGTVEIEEKYLVPADANVDALVKTDLEYDGDQYRMLSVSRKNIPGESTTKDVTVNRQKQVDTDDADAVLEQFPESLPYDSDGYTGTVYLDAESLMIATQAADAGTMETVAFIQLSGPNTDEDDEDDSASILRYLATVQYAGTVTHQTPNMLEVTLLYVPIAEPANDTTMPEQLEKIMPYVIGIVVIALILLALGAIFSHHRKQKAVEVDDDNEYDEGEAIEPAADVASSQAEMKPMDRPMFLQNLDRSGNDTLGEE